MLERRLRCVILDRVYDLWQEPAALQLFHDLVELKRRGFAAEYGYGVLPVDTLDLISTHFAIVEDGADGRLRPLLGARMTTLRRCRLFNQTFPALQLCHLASAPYHGSAFQQLLDRSLRDGGNPAYWGLWTVDPQARADPALLRFLVRALGGLGHLLAAELGVTEQSLGATLRFKVERSGRGWGFEPLRLDGTELPPLHVAHLLGEAVLLMRQQQPSAAARTLMASFRPFWEQRLVYAPQGRLHDDPPLPARAVAVPCRPPAPTPAGASAYLPSLLYARDRYGALPKVPVGRPLDYLKALLAIIGAAGTPSPREWAALHDLARKLGLPERMLLELAGFDWQHADLAALAAALDGPEVIVRLLYDALCIASEDGIGSTERRALARVAALLGVDSAQLDALAGLVADELALRRRRAAQLFPDRRPRAAAAGARTHAGGEARGSAAETAKPVLLAQCHTRAQAC